MPQVVSRQRLWFGKAYPPFRPSPNKSFHMTHVAVMVRVNCLVRRMGIFCLHWTVNSTLGSTCVVANDAGGSYEILCLLCGMYTHRELEWG